MSENVRLSPKKQKAIAALLAQGSIRGAASAVGISERQMARWLKQPDFQAALQTASEEALSATVRALNDASLSAVLVLRSILENPNVSASSRVRAGTALLSHVLGWHESMEFEARLARLRKLIEEGGRE